MNRTPDDFFRLQLELECKGIDANGDLVRIPGDNPDGMNRFHIVQYGDACRRYYRHDVPASLRDQLDRLSNEEAMQNRARIRALVETAMGPKDMWAGKTYTFERRPDSSEFPDVKQEEDRWVIAVNGRRLSWASSARQNKDAAELGIETAAEFRRRGLGRQVAAAWARAMLGEGRVAFYSHTLDNRASEKLARSLGVHPRFVFVGY